MGAQVTFSCEEGHQLMGVTEITCLESGEWSHLIPHCEGTLSKFFVCVVFGNLRNLRCRNVKCYVISVFFMFKTQLLGSSLNMTRKPRAALELLKIFAHTS